MCLRTGRRAMIAMFFQYSPDCLPKTADAARAARGMEDWAERVAKLDDPALTEAAEGLAGDPAGRSLLEAVFANSPFLTHCI